MVDSKIHSILSTLMQGKIAITYDDIVLMNNYCTKFLNDGSNMDTIKEILIISNILYNNTDRSVLPLEDGVYDLIVAKYNKISNGLAPVGAPPVEFKQDGNVKDNVNVTQSLDEPMFNVIKRTPITDAIFRSNVPSIAEDFMHDTSSTKVLEKNVRNIPAKYPELVGTLHKCKFVSIYEAMNQGIADDDVSVMIFDRDFLIPTFDTAVRYASGNGYVEIIAELKYDGMSIEAEIQDDKIVSANSRGDTANNIATDFTDVFGGKVFPRAKGIHANFGIKFEAIITYTNLEILKREYGIEYKNPRVAVSGLLASKYAAKFRDFITLVPIKTSGLQFSSAKEEVDFLNQYYSSGVTMQYSIFRTNRSGRNGCDDLMRAVTEFTNTAESLRPFMNYAYDGVVISYTSPEMKRILGRKNAIDLWSMAIKFNASVKNTYFEGYSFSVGQDGRITPMAHFMPVEFFGTTHDKTTVHSYKRFNQMQLRKGDIVSVKYVNDVICYLTKPIIPYNTALDRITPPEVFPTVCPFCGKPIMFSQSGDSAWCTNIDCPERIANTVVNMLKKLNIKDFGDASIRKLNIHNFTEFINIAREQAESVFGKDSLMVNKLLERVNEVKTKQWMDYQLLGAIGFDGISSTRWKLIMSYLTIDDLIQYTDTKLYNAIISIKGIGGVIANTIVAERSHFKDDLLTIASMKNVSHHSVMFDNPVVTEVRFSGIRNKKLEDLLNSKGFDADGDKGVTKKTSVLLIPYYGYSSTKVDKANKYGTKIMTIEDFLNAYMSK